MSNSRGRHAKARHAAPKKSLISPQTAGVAFTVASLGSVGVTSASTMAEAPTQNPDQILADAGLPNLTKATAALADKTSTAAGETRAQAASRSDARQNLEDAAAAATASVSGDPVEDVTVAIDATPVIDQDTQMSLAAVAGSTDELNSLVNKAEKEATDQNAKIKANRDALTAANAAAAAGLQQAIEYQHRLEETGKRVTPITTGYHLTARFGQRGSLWSRGWHTGLDFQVPSGTPVHAAAGGTIVKAGWAGAYGNRIEIDNGGGFITAYNHLSKIEKTSGWVDAGEEIALSGNTGNTTGPHLHFEVEDNGKLVNPATWLWGENR